MSKNKSIKLLQLLKVKLMSLILIDSRIKNDAMKMIEQTDSMIREIRKINTKLDVELLEVITDIMSIGIMDEHKRLTRKYR
jgi:hypothetical protein|tara:strand:- start:208 stop:450 length:243 start_codon:yes stop_codon:yes gene_type:complete